LKALQRELGITFLSVTHDQEEAMALSDRIALLSNGALEQVAAPRDLRASPPHAYTAQFIGQTNLCEAKLRMAWPDAERSNGPPMARRRAAVFSLRPRPSVLLPTGPAGSWNARYPGHAPATVFQAARANCSK